jgi:hypothetical protein
MREREDIGRYFWGVRIVRNKKRRLLNFYADKIEVRDGDLLLFGHMTDQPEGSFLYRSLARGTWFDVFAASCLDGSECGEDHDIDEATGEDARC